MLDECEQRKDRWNGLDDKLNKLWNALDVPKSEQKDFSYPKDEVPSIKLLEEMERELKRLRDLMRDKMKDSIAGQQELLTKLWDQLRTPEDERARFYNSIPDLYSEEGLKMLQDEVMRLHQMLLASKKLLKLILKRKAFIQKMLEFEVVATDPRRLFQSSRQLNKEEEFRRTAFPTLIKLEDSIREALQDFEQGNRSSLFV